MSSSAASLLVLGLMAGAGVSADLRMASQPDNGYNVQQRGPVQFVTKKALYMEPSDFAYQGLKDQRDGGAYDNFLRSNIDNEQDKRNFNTEAGRDMLPFRSMEGVSITDAADKSVKTKLPAGAAGTITATPGVSQVIPLRWNNPHSAELEVNVWILGNTVVVPVRKPACAGEGHQDAAFAFTIPADFNTEIPRRVPSFKGCKQVGDCVLQIYAHSVEPRQYAIGTPLIITGNLGPAGTTQDIEPARADPGTDISKQPTDFCLSSADPTADITTSVPRAARLISDVYNHAYQNSDYSPYSGQQPESISKNLQASVIISMIPGNRGELGAALLKKQNAAAAAYQAQLAAKVQNLKEQYEGVVNNIIAKIGDKVMQNQDQDGIGPGGAQKTAKAFRAAEVGSVTTERQTTTTYVPSFQLPKDQIAAAKALVPAKYAGLITADGKVQIYQAVLNDFKAEFNTAKDKFGLEYQGPAIKTSIGTMADPKQFKKLDANNKQDNGVYAAQLAQTALKAQKAVQDKFDIVDTSLLLDVLSAADGVLPATGVDPVPAYLDMNAVTADRLCDSDKYVEANPQVDCTNQPLGPVMFKPSPDGSTLQTQTPTPQGTSNSNTASTITSGIAAFALSAVAAIFLA